MIIFVKSGTDFFSVKRRNPLENLLSVPEAARKLGGISKWTIHAWLSQGRLQRTKVGGRTMIRESELEKVIQDGGKSPSPRKG
jgi:excisionase family DNA binding protein